MYCQFKPNIPFIPSVIIRHNPRLAEYGNELFSGMLGLKCILAPFLHMPVQLF
jgi:hypothetical protein